MSQVSQEEVNGLTLQRDKEVVPFAKAVIKAMAEQIDDIPIGAHGTDGVATKDEFNERMRTFYKDTFIPLALEYNIKLDDLAWLFMLMLQPLSALQSKTDQMFAENKEIADAVVYGIAPGEMRIKDLDEAMKRTPVDKSESDKK
jgi:hypothetical protein